MLLPERQNRGKDLILKHDYVLLGHITQHGSSKGEQDEKSKSFISFNLHKDLKSFRLHYDQLFLFYSLKQAGSG